MASIAIPLVALACSRFVMMAHGPAGTSLRQKLKAQRSGDRGGFDQFDYYRVAKPVGLARARSDHGMAFLVIAEIFITDCARWHKAVGAGFTQFHE